MFVWMSPKYSLTGGKSEPCFFLVLSWRLREKWHVFNWLSNFSVFSHFFILKSINNSSSGRLADTSLAIFREKLQAKMPGVKLLRAIHRDAKSKDARSRNALGKLAAAPLARLAPLLASLTPTSFRSIPSFTWLRQCFNQMLLGDGQLKKII